MNNLERFTKALNWEPVNRILTYGFTDSLPLLEQLGGYDPARRDSWPVREPGPVSGRR